MSSKPRAEWLEKRWTERGVFEIYRAFGEATTSLADRALRTKRGSFLLGIPAFSECRVWAEPLGDVVMRYVPAETSEA